MDSASVVPTTAATGVGFLGFLTKSTTADIALNSTGSYFDGPSVSQGTSGVWFATGTVTLKTSAGSAGMSVKLWDGTNVAASAAIVNVSADWASVGLSGVFNSPAGNIRLSANSDTITSKMVFSQSAGNTSDSTITVIRIG